LSEKKPTNPKEIVGAKKVLFSVLPWGIVVGLAMGMLEGALKYGRHNYRFPLPGAVEDEGPPVGTSVRASIYFDALLRHVISWWEGEDIDPDSGYPHLWKASCCIAVMDDAILNGTFHDDRPPPSEVPALIRRMNDATKAMVEGFSGTIKKAWITS
jgi:hypothetical protein